MPRSDDLGSGVFGTAYDIGSNKRLNQVTKVGRTGDPDSKKSTATEVEQDGFLVYLKSIQRSNNPYFPEIHDLKITRSTEDSTLSYVVNMRRLIPFYSEKIAGNDDLMRSLYSDMFYGQEYGYYNPRNPAGSILKTLEQASKMPELVKDERLGAALKVISTLASKYDFNTDLHAGNVMWKITGNRPQLILLDPLA
jgi:hypothetical protein